MSDGISVLAAMTGAVTATVPAAKAAKPRLSLLPGETNGASILTAPPAALPVTPATFPYDAPTDALLHTIHELERQRAALTGIIDGLRLLAGDPEVVAADIAKDAAVTAKLIEVEADRRIKDAAEAAKAAPDKKDKTATAVHDGAVKRAAAAEASPIDAVVTASEARDRKRAIMLAALVEAGTTDEETMPERMARQAAEAQAATFTPAIAAAVEAVEAGGGPVEVMAAAMAADGWVCPTHGQVTTKTSVRRNRDYQACPVAGCAQYERL